MRVLFISNLYPPNTIGGYERLCFEVASAFARQGHSVFVLTSTHGTATADYEGQTVYRRLQLLIGGTIYSPFAGSEQERQSINAGNIGALRMVMTETAPDVIFVWNLFFLDSSLLDAIPGDPTRTALMLTDNWLIGMREPVFLGAYFRDHVFGDHPFAPGETHVVAPPRWLHRSLGWLGGPRNRSEAPAPRPLPFAAVFGSVFMRDLYAAAGITFPRAAVIHNGVRQARRATADFIDRTNLVEQNTLRLLFAGRLVDLKGVETAVKAVPILNRLPLPVARIELTILGDAQDLASLERLDRSIEDSACQEQIRRLDSVAEDALFDLFQSYDIYLFPSLYEPFSLTLIHALASGIPTVASRTGGNPEIMTEGLTDCLFRKGDAADLARAVQTLATDATLRIRVAAEARRTAARFTFEAMIDGMTKFLMAPRQ